MQSAKLTKLQFNLFCDIDNNALKFYIKMALRICAKSVCNYSNETFSENIEGGVR